MDKLIISKATISDSKVMNEINYIMKNSFYRTYGSNTNKINNMNNKTNNNMNTVNNNTSNTTNNIKKRTKVRTIPLSLREAVQWYNSNNATRKELALKFLLAKPLELAFDGDKLFISLK